MLDELEIAELAEDYVEELQNELVEPCLKYKTIGHGLDDITGADSVSCISVHQKFVAIGTQWGRVYLLDHSGYLAQSNMFNLHSTAVSQISISEQGDYVASCASDGRIGIYNLSEPDKNQTVHLEHTITSIALSPNYDRSQTLVFGYSKVVILSRGTFTKLKQDEMAKANGMIDTIKWNGEFILWADDKCVCAYDTRDRRPIAYMQFAVQDVDSSGQLPKCNLCWCNESCFLIGRGHSVRVCQIVERYLSTDRPISSSTSRSLNSSSQSLTSPESRSGLPSRYVDILHQFELSSHSTIHGISRHQTNLLILWSSNWSSGQKNRNNNKQIIDPEILVADIGLVPSGLQSTNTTQGYTELYREKLVFQKPIDPVTFGLTTVPKENTHYIFSSKEMICAQELTVDDRIDWMLENGLYSQALETAQHFSRNLYTHTVQSVGIAYINHLLGERLFNDAAQLCSQVLVDKEAWEDHVYKFLHVGQLQALTPFLPLGVEEKSIKLDPSIFEVVLIDCMEHDTKQFVQLLMTWCKIGILTIYSTLMSNLSDRIDRQTAFIPVDHDISKLDDDIKLLYQALAVLHEYSGSVDLAINLLVRLRDPIVFSLLTRNLASSKNRRLIDVLEEHLIFFMQLDTSKAVAILMDLIEDISIDFVVHQLSSEPKFLFYYLDSIYGRSPQMLVPYLIQLIQLYIKFCRPKLMPLLRSTDNYPLSEALKLCEQAQFVPETVYLLTRIGRRQDALNLIMTKGGDDLSPETNHGQPVTLDQRQAAAAAAAIAYCREEDGVSRKFSHKRRIYKSQTTNRKSVSSSPTKMLSGPTDHVVDDEDDDDENAGELWQQVVLFAVDKPAFICALLKHAGSEGLDPRLLLRKISPDMTIPGLKDSLIKLMHDYKIQLSLNQSCERILAEDMHKLFLRVFNTQTKGIRVNVKELVRSGCVCCSQPLPFPTNKPTTTTTTTTTTNKNDSVHPELGLDLTNSTENLLEKWALFHCKHVCHEKCLNLTMEPNASIIKCPICPKSKIIF